MPVLDTKPYNVYEYNTYVTAEEAFDWTLADEDVLPATMDPVKQELTDESHILVSNEQYLRCLRLFDEQFSRFEGFFDTVDRDSAREKHKKCLAQLLCINPDVISLEVTADKSIFYTLRKDNLTFFFQYFLEAIYEDDADEAILSVFRERKCVGNYAGWLVDVLGDLRKYTALPANTVNIFAEHAVSM